MSRSLVSIVIAAYRSKPEHLLAAVESARAQTWHELEILVSDDSPTSALQSVVEGLADSRIRYFHHSPALGVARNHWWCFGRSNGEYIAILNHDDLLEPEFVEALVGPLICDGSLALAFCDHWIVDSVGRRLVAETESASRAWGRKDLREAAHRPFLLLLAAQAIPMAMGTVFRKAALPARLPDHAGPAYDLWLTYLLARNGLGAFYVARRLSAWRTHEGNLTSRSSIDWLLGAADCWRAVADDGMCTAIRAHALAKAARGHSSSALKAILGGHSADGALLARRSLSSSVTLRGLGTWGLSFLPLPVLLRLLALTQFR